MAAPIGHPIDDNPEWTEEDFANATRVEDLPAGHRDALLAAFPKTAARIGRPPKAQLKVPVSIRLDPEIVRHFKAGGPGWQSRLNDALRGVIATSGAGIDG